MDRIMHWLHTLLAPRCAVCKRRDFMDLPADKRRKLKKLKMGSSSTGRKSVSQTLKASSNLVDPPKGLDNDSCNK